MSNPTLVRPPVMLLLTAVIFLLAQFIGEYVIIYGIIEFFPNFAATLYASKQVIAVVHMALTVILVIYAKRLSSKVYTGRS